MRSLRKRKNARHLVHVRHVKKIIFYSVCVLAVFVVSVFSLRRFILLMPADEIVTLESSNDKFVELYEQDLPSAGVVSDEEQFLMLPSAGSGCSDFTDAERFVAVLDDSYVSPFIEKELEPEESAVVAEVKKETKKEVKEEKSNSGVAEDKERAHASEDVNLAASAGSVVMSDEFADLCTMIHLEAGEGASVESKAYVANVAMNRLRNPGKWGYSTLHEVLYAPRQFSVVYSDRFKKKKSQFLSMSLDANMQASVTAATLAYTGSAQYSIDPAVQYFYGDPNKRSWGSHTYCFTFGGNSFFK